MRGFPAAFSRTTAFGSLKSDEHIAPIVIGEREGGIARRKPEPKQARKTMQMTSAISRSAAEWR